MGERVLSDVWATLTSTASSIWGPVQATIDANLPGFGYKVLGILGALIGYNISVMYVTNRTEAWMFLEKMRLYAVGNELVHSGFFRSDAEEADVRQEHYAHDTDRLNALWEEAL